MINSHRKDVMLNPKKRSTPRDHTTLCQRAAPSELGGEATRHTDASRGEEEWGKEEKEEEEEEMGQQPESAGSSSSSSSE